MLSMGGYCHMVAGLHVNRRVVTFEEQLRFTFQHDHPLGSLLSVPEVFGAGLAGRDDPLDPNVLVLSENFNEFLGRIGR